MLTWDNRVMGLRDETRTDGILVQTYLGMVLRDAPRGETIVVACAGLRVLAVVR